MMSLLKQLDSDQAVLLMYIADELPPADRAEVDRRLGSEPGLREQLDSLRAEQAAVQAMLEAGDRATPLPVSAPVAVRNVVRSIRQWQIDRLRPQPEGTRAASTLRYPWWVYPSVSAAALFLAFLVWWGNWGHDRVQPETTATRFDTSYDPEAEAFVSGFASNMTPSEEHVSGLMSIDAEFNELASLSQGSDDMRELFNTFAEEGM